jgi:hypothetical protein
MIVIYYPFVHFVLSVHLSYCITSDLHIAQCLLTCVSQTTSRSGHILLTLLFRRDPAMQTSPTSSESRQDIKGLGDLPG